MNSNQPPVPKIILFDWDNTLIDTWDCICQALNYTLGEMGHPLYTPEELNRKIRKTSKEHFYELFGEEKGERARKIFYDYFHENHIAALKVIEGAENVIKGLSELSVPLGIVSTKRGEYLRLEVDHLNWRPYFKAIIGSGDSEFDKPHQACIDKALQDMGCREVNYQDVWYVGDTEMDMMMAKTAGCIPIFIKTQRMYSIQKMMEEDLSVYCCKNLTQFYKICRKILGK